MTKDEEIAGLDTGDGCLAKAAGNEPLFILRAQDSLSADIVRVWADMVEQRHHANGSLDLKVKRKVDEARALARRMDEWPGRHLPD